MKQSKVEDGEMRPDCAREMLGPLVRGKYAARYAKATNVVVIDASLAEALPNSEAVNDALRSLLAVATAATGLTARPRKTSRRRATA